MIARHLIRVLNVFLGGAKNQTINKNNDAMEYGISYLLLLQIHKVPYKGRWLVFHYCGKQIYMWDFLEVTTE